MNHHEWQERAWRDAVLAGDSQVWQEWLESVYPEARAYALWRAGGDEAFADDVLQEAFMVVIRKLASFEPQNSSFLHWLYAIIGNVARNQLRSEIRQRRREMTVATNHAPDQIDLDDEIVARALATLSDRYELVLRAKYFESRSVAEIAKQESVSEKAIESLLTRAREAFRQAYLSLGGDDAK